MRVTPIDSQAGAAEPAARSRVARSLPRWAALPAAAGLIAIVAFASRSTSLAPGGATIDLGPARIAIEVVGYVALAMGVVLLIPALALFGGKRRRRKAGDDPVVDRELSPIPVWAKILGLLATLAVVAGETVVVLAYLAELWRARGAGANGSSDTILGPDPSSLGSAGRDATSLAIALVVVMVLVVLLLVIAIRWRRAEDPRLTVRGGDRDATIAYAAEVSLDALRAEPDPRRAVIAAYAAMERVLSGAGLGRWRSEAPMEYLRRVLPGSTSAAEEVRTITHLFQFAKFSRHPVDESMRSGAIHALERIRTTMSRAG